MPRFSILIPVYNVEQYIADCLQSVLGQTFSDCEVIAVDDGSADRSGQILDEYQETFARRGVPYLVIHQENKGLGAARNTAIDNATGEYLVFLDSDDMLQPQALEVLDTHLDGEDLLCFNGQRYFEETHTLEPPQPLQDEGPISGIEYFNRHALEARRFAFVCVVLRCVRRQFLMDKSLLFDDAIYHEDNLFTPMECIYAQRVSTISDVLYTYRVRPGSITAHRTSKHKRDLVIIANNLSLEARQHYDSDSTVLYRYITQLYQMAFAESTAAEDHGLTKTVNWTAYHKASRTKARHRILYQALRISPRLFRFLLKAINLFA